MQPCCPWHDIGVENSPEEVQRTCEELADEEAPADLREDLVPQEAARLVAALRHVQDCVAPHHLSKGLVTGSV